MSWATIRTALATRIDAVAGTGPVHAYWRWSDQGPEEAAWRTLFASGTAVNAWLITRVGMPRTVPATPSAALAARWLRRHDVEVSAFYSLDDSAATESTFQDLLDAVEADLRTGDRTLVGVAITHSLPEVSPIGHASLSSVLCHQATLKFTVEELLT